MLLNLSHTVEKHRVAAQALSRQQLMDAILRARPKMMTVATIIAPLLTMLVIPAVYPLLSKENVVS